MGDQVTVDPTALRKAGSNLKASAADIGVCAADAKWTFTAKQAGREYGAEGAKVGAVIGKVETWLKNWQTAVDKTGAQMTTSADSYATSDDASVSKITAAGVNL
ncbi:type VII secretion target [Nocardia caishijiensis]|uniref:Excreted virulence factor EspC (Type VII ESX diderm) n=1 Tax=Nocardia caishijiensis TaxID=184756 RepID=A0ABQ6YRC8_9NOCA|nr:type VII secretion target [Nocardia caishijiensis]KAF0848354.1 hypothetical protein FNL39_102502 [Nocardia caishijiensis]